METVRLNNGTPVLARTMADGRKHAYTYVNQTQARRRLEQLATQGIVGRIYQHPVSRIRYITVPIP